MCIPIKTFQRKIVSLEEGSEGNWATEVLKKNQKKTLTCPIIFKAVEEMEDHHDQRVKRDECNVHLGRKKTRGHNKRPFTTYINCKTQRVVFTEESLSSASVLYCIITETTIDFLCNTSQTYKVIQKRYKKLIKIVTSKLATIQSQLLIVTDFIIQWKFLASPH